MKSNLNDQIDLNRIEFFITNKCTSRCEHCSVYSKDTQIYNDPIDLIKAEKLINDLTKIYNINSLMAFGGEPLLYPELVCGIHKAANNCNISTRQIITNGYWSNDKNRINEIISMLSNSEVNNILVSIDCFHEKYLNYEIVKYTVEQLKKNIKGNLQLHPVWVRSKDDNNSYNEKTKKILCDFIELNISESDGNTLFPSGRALINLSEFLPKFCVNIKGSCKDQKYTDMPNDVKSICVEPNGNVVVCNIIGNLNNDNITDIFERYDYKKDQVLNAMVEAGSDGLYLLADKYGLELSKNGYYSVCELCKDVSKKIRKKNA